ncbi:MAG: hypothetical protein ACRDFB_04360 [Rhabdochlamydiaceae bacterium]
MNKHFTGKTRLQKLVFLSQEEFNAKFDYEFKPATFGPLSYRLLDSVEELKKLDFLKEIQDSTGLGNKVYKYEITSEGRKVLHMAIESKIIPESILHANQNVMKEYGDMPHVELLDYVHDKYPDYLDE